jgi:hypothetical protein
MRLDRIGPLGLWNRFDERWIGTRRAAQLFLIASLFVVGLLPVFLGRIEPSNKPSPVNFFWGIMGVVGTPSIFFLWLGMWRYWARLDASGKWIKRFWFLVMLAGFCYGSCLYCWSVYLPQVIRSGRQGVTAPLDDPIRRGSAEFGKALAVVWLCFFIFVALIFAFPKVALAIGVVGMVQVASIPLVLTSFAYVIGWLYRQGVRPNRPLD